MRLLVQCTHICLSFVYNMIYSCNVLFYFLPSNAGISFCELFEYRMRSYVSFLCIAIIEWFNEGFSAKKDTW